MGHWPDACVELAAEIEAETFDFMRKKQQQIHKLGGIFEKQQLLQGELRRVYAKNRRNFADEQARKKMPPKKKKQQTKKPLKKKVKKNLRRK